MATTQIVGGVGGQYDIVFDANFDYTLEFTYNGNQIIKNRLLIKDNESNVTVYDQTVTTMAKRHTIAAGSLDNGDTYNMSIQVYYLNDEGEEVADDVSDTVLAKCFTTPSLTASNLPLVVRNASFDFEFDYTQAEDDMLDSYTISMYDSGNNLLYALNPVYPAPSTVAYSFVVTINDLMDGQNYHIRCEATSVAGMHVDTGLLSFAVQYYRPQNYSIFYVDNAPSLCAVQLTSNVKIIDGFTVSGEEPTYIDGEKADLRDGDAVYWQNMIDMSGDFQLMARLEDFNDYSEIIKLSNGINTIALKTMRGLLYGETEEKAYLSLTVSNGINNYVTISNLIPIPAPTDIFFISLVRRGYVYSVSINKEV